MVEKGLYTSLPKLQSLWDTENLSYQSCYEIVYLWSVLIQYYPGSFWVTIEIKFADELRITNTIHVTAYIMKSENLFAEG